MNESFYYREELAERERERARLAQPPPEVPAPIAPDPTEDVPPADPEIAETIPPDPAEEALTTAPTLAETIPPDSATVTPLAEAHVPSETAETLDTPALAIEAITPDEAPAPAALIPEDLIAAEQPDPSALASEVSDTSDSPDGPAAESASAVTLHITVALDAAEPFTATLASIAAPAPRPRRLSGLSILAFGMAFVVLLGTLVAWQPWASAVPTTTPLQTTNATPRPLTATPTPVPGLTMAQRNARNGCAAGAPKPYPDAIFTGQNPASKLAVPNEVALTFDDGPTPYSTPTILSFLEATHTPASFFVEGNFAATWPELVRREWNDGFAIGLHTWNHPQLTLQPDSTFAHQFGDTLAAIHHAIGSDACIWLMRPPYGATDRHVLNVTMGYGLTTIIWDDSSADWKRWGASVIADIVLTHVHPGGIILLHDGPAEREQTAEALPLILAGLKARGLTPVTIPQLLQDGHFPGVVVANGP